MLSLEDLTAVTINYRTLDLVRTCVESFIGHYPQVATLIIDNGSQDHSSEYILHVCSQSDSLSCLLNQRNIFHGPAMDQAMRHCQTRYVFIMDSDCMIHRPGFLEQMLSEFANPQMYAVGDLRDKNKLGYPASRFWGARIKYIEPYAMLLDREKYLALPAFIHHGAPAIQNMRAAQQRGYHVQDFRIEDFIWHAGRGTCGRYGYGLGPKTYLQGILFQHLPNMLARWHKIKPPSP